MKKLIEERECAAMVEGKCLKERKNDVNQMQQRKIHTNDEFLYPVSDHNKPNVQIHNPTILIKYFA